MGGINDLAFQLFYLAFQLSSHPYLCTCEIRKQSDKNFFSSNQKYETNIIYFIFGGGGPGGPLRQTQGYQFFLSHRVNDEVSVEAEDTTIPWNPPPPPPSTFIWGIQLSHFDVMSQIITSCSSIPDSPFSISLFLTYHAY